MVIGTDFIGSCKSNYHRITATTAPRRIKGENKKGLRLGKGERVKDEEKREGIRVKGGEKVEAIKMGKRGKGEGKGGSGKGWRKG